MEEHIEFKNIETPEAVKGFRELIEEKKEGRYQTIFLNGKWGSGKTTFLEKASDSLEKTSELNKKSYKFIYLKLWETRDERTVIQIAFKELHTFYYWLMKLFVIVCVVISLLLTPAFNMGLSDFLSNIVLKWIIVIIALSVSVAQLFKIKSDNFYLEFFHLLNSEKFFLKIFTYFSKPKVLIIDDFDRVDHKKQLEAYKLFNILHGLLPIVFVGDYDKLIKQEDISFEYLSKIVDRKVELPFLLSSNKIAANISNKLLDFMEENQEEINPQYKAFIKNVFLSSRFSMREWKRYVETLNDQIDKKGGPENVSVRDLSIIVYLYLFYPLDYQELISNYDNNYEFNSRKGSTDFNEVSKDSYKFYIKEVLLQCPDQKKFPRIFYENAKMYFLDDYVSNLSKDEANKIFGDPEKLEKKLLEKTLDMDFYYYVQNLHSNEIDSSDQILNCIFSTIKSNTDIQIQLAQSIIDIFGNKQKTDEEKFRLFEEYTNKYDFTVEEKCHFYIKFGYANEYISNQLYQEIMVEIEQLNENSKYNLEIFRMLLLGDSKKIKENSMSIIKLSKYLTKDDAKKLLNFINEPLKKMSNPYVYISKTDYRNKLKNLIHFEIGLVVSKDIINIGEDSIKSVIGNLNKVALKDLLKQLDDSELIFTQSSEHTDGANRNDTYTKFIESVRRLIVIEFPN
ncbi:P-loop NTPase fold protein [Streptococcus sanguinis]